MTRTRIVLTCAWIVLITSAYSTSAQNPGYTTNTYTVGNQPFSVTVADLNGDGYPDLICANTGNYPNYGNTLILLTNNGSGVFGSNATLNVGTGPNFVVAADINSDGKLDLICANAQFPGSLTVLTNAGGGVFGSNATVSIGGMPNCVAVADVNGDGKPDLIAPNGDGTLIVLTNNGSGAFGVNATLSVGNGPVFVTTLDVNGDGKPDLVYAVEGAGLLQVLTNDGSGVFGLNATLTLDGYPTWVAAADVNGDGKMDLISANGAGFGSYGNTMTVLTNDGSGNFGSNATLNVGNAPFCVAAADMNGDGKPDLVGANYADNTLMVLTNNGRGVFGSNATFQVGSKPMSVVAADINGDGRPDLISANSGDGTLTVLTQVVPTPPKLAIKSTAKNVFAVSWSSISTNFALQTNSDLTGTNWAKTSGPVSITGGTNQSITYTSSQPVRLFFRLKQ